MGDRRTKKFFRVYRITVWSQLSSLSIYEIVRSLIERWGSQGILVSLYLDDELIWAPTERECAAAVAVIRQDLELAGVCVATEK